MTMIKFVTFANVAKIISLIGKSIDKARHTDRQVKFYGSRKRKNLKMHTYDTHLQKQQQLFSKCNYF